MDERNPDAKIEKGKSVLFIDGKYFEKVKDKKLDIKGIASIGIPVVIIGGNVKDIQGLIENIPSEESFSTDENGNVVSTPTLAYGIKVFPNKPGSVPLTHQMTIDGTDTLEEIVTASYGWSTARVSNDLPPNDYAAPVAHVAMTPVQSPDGIVPATHTTPSWSQTAQFTSYNSYNPQGKMNLIRTWYKLTNDGSTTYDWRNWHLITETVPGKIAYNSNWANSHTWAKSDVNQLQAPNLLIDREPTSTSGTTSVSVAIGTTAGTSGASVTATQTWSYDISDVVVSDQGDYSLQLAYWQHNIDERKNVGLNTYQSKPGLSVRVPQSQLFNQYQQYKASFADCNILYCNYWDSAWKNITTNGT